MIINTLDIDTGRASDSELVTLNHQNPDAWKLSPLSPLTQYPEYWEYWVNLIQASTAKHAGGAFMHIHRAQTQNINKSCHSIESKRPQIFQTNLLEWVVLTVLTPVWWRAVDECDSLHTGHWRLVETQPRRLSLPGTEQTRNIFNSTNTNWTLWSHLTGDILWVFLVKRHCLHFRDSGGGVTVTRKKSVQEVKCRIEDGSQDNKVSIQHTFFYHHD